ncbi:MAG: addiction module protein [Proteobacteria bacterium]|nr:addiction module protein [Pseudomonadota bacterium]
MARKLLGDILALPEDERLELAREIIASVDGPREDGWDMAWLAELRRRSHAASERQEPASEWPEVRARVLKRITSQ